MAKWIRMIPREGLVVVPKTVVCEKHFADQFVVRYDSAVRPDGTVLTVRRGTPKLTLRLVCPNICGTTEQFCEQYDIVWLAYLGS